MISLHRPTLDQIVAIGLPTVADKTALEVRKAALKLVSQALRHVTEYLDVPVGRQLQAELAERGNKWIQEHGERENRYPFVLPAKNLYPVPNHMPLTATFAAYQDGAALLIHITWQWDSKGSTGTFKEQLLDKLWHSTISDEHQLTKFGEGLLLSATLMTPHENTASVVQGVLESLDERPEIPPTRFGLQGASLYVHREAVAGRRVWPSVLIFESRAVEDSEAADRLATVHWPLVTLHHLHLEWLYGEDYRKRVFKLFDDRNEPLRKELSRTFGGQLTSDGSRTQTLLIKGNPADAQSVLEKLSLTQYDWLDAVSEASLCAHQARRELANLEAVLRRALANVLVSPSTDTAIEGVSVEEIYASGSGRAAWARIPTVEEIEPAVAELTRRGRHFVAQIESDIAEAQLLAQWAVSGVEVLRTHAEILESKYGRQLTLLLGAVGTGLAMGQLLDKDTARVIYQDLGVGMVWEQLGGLALGQGHDDLVLFGVRVLAVLLAAVGAYLLSCLVLKFTRT